jgi:hypothetical protein
MEHNQSNIGLAKCHDCGVRSKQLSNPTSNFNWQMPTATDLVTDLPADFEVFGQAVDTSLADLKGGTAGQFLKKNTNTDMDFVWANSPGKVLQVVSTTYTTAVTSTSTTYADTGLSLSITPTSATSKVLVILTQAVGVERSAAYAMARLKLVRGATDLQEFSGGTHKQRFGAEYTGPTYMFQRGSDSFQYLDSPATTSATTYKMQGGVAQQPGGPTITAYFQYESSVSSMILLEIGA